MAGQDTEVLLTGLFRQIDAKSAADTEPPPAPTHAVPKAGFSFQSTPGGMTRSMEALSLKPVPPFQSLLIHSQDQPGFPAQVIGSGDILQTEPIPQAVRPQDVSSQARDAVAMAAEAAAELAAQAEDSVMGWALSTYEPFQGGVVLRNQLFASFLDHWDQLTDDQELPCPVNAQRLSALISTVYPNVVIRSVLLGTKTRRVFMGIRPRGAERQFQSAMATAMKQQQQQAGESGGHRSHHRSHRSSRRSSVAAVPYGGGMYQSGSVFTGHEGSQPDTKRSRSSSGSEAGSARSPPTRTRRTPSPADALAMASASRHLTQAGSKRRHSLSAELPSTGGTALRHRHRFGASLPDLSEAHAPDVELMFGRPMPPFGSPEPSPGHTEELEPRCQRCSVFLSPEWRREGARELLCGACEQHARRFIVEEPQPSPADLRMADSFIV